MALRLHHDIVRGEIINIRPYSTHGWLELRGKEGPVMFELTGDCDPDLRGRRVRFEARPDPYDPPDPDAPPTRIHPHQVGPTGTMTADDWVKTFACSVEEFLHRAKAGEKPPTTWKRRLYLEWFSQNGCVVIELADPVIECLEGEEWKPLAMTRPRPADDEEPAAPGGLGIVSIERDGDDAIVQRAEMTGEPADEASLSPAERLQRQLDSQTRAVDRALGGDGADDDDEDVMAEIEMMDKLIESEAREPILSIFDTPRRLPRADDLAEEEVEPLLKSLLAEMAMAGVALHVCEHFTPRDTYRLLVERLVHEEGFFPELRGTGWVQNFMTSEYCPKCEAEAEGEWEENERQGETDGPEDGSR